MPQPTASSSGKKAHQIEMAGQCGAWASLAKYWEFGFNRYLAYSYNLNERVFRRRLGGGSPLEAKPVVVPGAYLCAFVTGGLDYGMGRYGRLTAHLLKLLTF
jgi:hypothetical protein